MDPQDNFVWAYFSKIGWRESNQFSNLCFESRGACVCVERNNVCHTQSSKSLSFPSPDLLDFSMPRGFRLGVTGISTRNFQNGFSFNLNGQKSAAFLFSSLALEPKHLQYPYAHFFPDEVRPLPFPPLFFSFFFFSFLFDLFLGGKSQLFFLFSFFFFLNF